MSGFLLFLILSLVTPGTTGSQHRDSIPDRQLLGMAVDYFASGKYHEALVLFIKLDKKYKLNPRFIAYTGVCYYHEQDYAAACRYLDKAIPSLDIYSPAERVVYYNAAADSHFRLEEYAAAIPGRRKRPTCYTTSASATCSRKNGRRRPRHLHLLPNITRRLRLPAARLA